ncbi:hypothetical protein NE237_030213 [Protea cynaroides]|uniref:K+ potassium transporter integral membrane domain-containing protein n=1 Tax=Protea cynaroides TaxID=273540 RepID=A0A9Q0GUM5_9MAGN|nr:hypothetical protein NE237_030213 [Protea cynaroides]
MSSSFYQPMTAVTEAHLIFVVLHTCPYVKVAFTPNQPVEDKDGCILNYQTIDCEGLLLSKLTSKEADFQRELWREKGRKVVRPEGAAIVGVDLGPFRHSSSSTVGVEDAVGGVRVSDSTRSVTTVEPVSTNVAGEDAALEVLLGSKNGFLTTRLKNYATDRNNPLKPRGLSVVSQYFLLFMTMLGTSLILGDVIITPCISVLSAVGGIKEATSSFTDDTIMWISVMILILLFHVQRFGTDKVGYTFAPILTIWFLFIAVISLHNFIRHDTSVIKAINPISILRYFQRNKKNAWLSLGGVILCLAGSEALFADLGHFNVRSIQISTCAIVYPSIILSYVGQAAYLRRHPLDASDAFYKSVPKPMYWPMFVGAVTAAIIAKPVVDLSFFSIVQQYLALGCLSQVKVVHSSSKYEGQVYIPGSATYSC